MNTNQQFTSSALQISSKDSGYRAFAHCVRALGRKPQDFFDPDGLDFDRLRQEAGRLSGGERRLMSAALQLYNGLTDPTDLDLPRVSLQDLVTTLDPRLFRVLVEAMAMRGEFQIGLAQSGGQAGGTLLPFAVFRSGF